MGPDSYNDGTVICYRKRFTSQGKAYIYAAAKAHGIWYTTGLVGKVSQPLTWEKLTLWLVSGQYPTATFEVLREGGQDDN